MPELPEVETIRRGLERCLVGLTLKGVDVLLRKQFRGEVGDVLGARVVAVRRRGKITAVDLSNGKSLLVHLKLTGQLVFQRGKDKFLGGHPIPFAGTTLPAKTTHVIFHFGDGSTLFYNDIRQFGWIKVAETAKLESESEFSKLGPEPLTREFTADYLKGVLAKTAKPVKLVLMDQEKVSGVGNIYANDALFEAKIDPRRPAKSLSRKETSELFDAIGVVLREGIKYGGSSENAFVNVEGEMGSYQDHTRVYGKGGEDCPGSCGGQIRRIELGGRGTFFCPKCQK